jgi:hypothetical protein
MRDTILLYLEADILQGPQGLGRRGSRVQLKVRVSFFAHRGGPPALHILAQRARADGAKPVQLGQIFDLNGYIRHAELYYIHEFVALLVECQQRYYKKAQRENEAVQHLP